jgi:hypothetical protein
MNFIIYFIYIFITELDIYLNIYIYKIRIGYIIKNKFLIINYIIKSKGLLF